MMGMRNQKFPQNPEKIEKPILQLFRTKILWDQYLQNFNNIPDTELYCHIGIFCCKDFPVNETDLIKYIDESGREDRIRSITIRLMGTPEYQLC